MGNQEREKSIAEIGCETRFHEAGHAVGAVKLDIGLDARGIEIESNCEAATYVHELPPEQWTKRWCIRRAAVKLSGAAAEMRVRGQEYHPDTLQSDCHYAKDYQEAEELLKRFQLNRGQCIPEQVAADLCEALEAGHNVISRNWRGVEEIARTLLSKRQLHGSEIVEIIDRAEANNNVGAV